MAGVPGQAANKPLFPAANVLTQGLQVKPGSVFDSMIDFSFNSCKFTVDIGYSLFWKDKESIRVKKFENGKLALAAAAFNTIGAFETSVAANVFKVVNLVDLDIDAAKTPSLLSHKLSAGMGYTATMYKKYLASVGLGASYEFGTTNADVENYALWAKAAFSF